MHGRGHRFESGRARQMKIEHSSLGVRFSFGWTGLEPGRGVGEREFSVEESSESSSAENRGFAVLFDSAGRA